MTILLRVNSIIYSTSNYYTVVYCIRSIQGLIVCLYVFSHMALARQYLFPSYKKKDNKDKSLNIRLLRDEVMIVLMS